MGDAEGTWTIASATSRSPKTLPKPARDKETAASAAVLARARERECACGCAGRAPCPMPPPCNPRHAFAHASALVCTRRPGHTSKGTSARHASRSRREHGLHVADNHIGAVASACMARLV